MVDEREPFPFGEHDEDRESRTGFVQEWVKKAAVAGLGAIFMTEEGIRSLAGQMKLPKELLAFILAGAEKTKDELTRVISDEIRRFLESENLREEFLKLLARTTLEVTAHVRLVPGEGSPTGKPRTTLTDIHVKRGGRPKKDEGSPR